MSTVDVRLKENVSPKLKRLEKFFKGDNKFMNEIGAFETAMIKARTQSGKDVFEQAFRPYADSTKKIRQKAGRPVNKVNLFFTGQMQGSLTHRVLSGLSVKLFFATVEQAEKARKNQKTRQFFGISDKDETAIQNMFKNKVNEIIQDG